MLQIQPRKSNLKRFIRHVLPTTSVLYLVFLATFFGYRLFDNYWRPSLTLVNNFAPWLFIPLVVLIPLVIWMGNRWARAAVAGIGLLFLVLYGRNFIAPVIKPHCESVQTLKVMTFNLGWHRGDPDALRDMILEQHPDILVLEELTQATYTMFEEELTEQFPYQILDDPGLASRYPIRDVTYDFHGWNNRWFMRVVVEWDNADIVVYGIHPYPPGLLWIPGTLIPRGVHDEPTQLYIADILALAQDEMQLVLIMGDFNLSDQTWVYGEITNTFTDAYRQAGWGFGYTFPNGSKVGDLTLPGSYTRLDYIFHSDDFCTQSAKRVCGGGSDHCAVVAELGYPEE